MELDKILAIVLSRDKAVFFQSKISTNHLRYMMTIYQGTDYSSKDTILFPPLRNINFVTMIKYDSGSNRVFGRGLTALFAKSTFKETILDLVIISEPVLQFKPYAKLENSMCHRTLKGCANSHIQIELKPKSDKNRNSKNALKGCGNIIFGGFKSKPPENKYENDKTLNFLGDSSIQPFDEEEILASKDIDLYVIKSDFRSIIPTREKLNLELQISQNSFSMNLDKFYLGTIIQPKLVRQSEIMSNFRVKGLKHTGLSVSNSNKGFLKNFNHHYNYPPTIVEKLKKML